MLRAHILRSRESFLGLSRMSGACLTVDEMRTHLKRIQYEQRDGDAYIGERDEFDEEGEQEEDAMSLESPAAAAERARRFAVIAELLTAAELGTS
jgi:hypothetical protein